MFASFPRDPNQITKEDKGPDHDESIETAEPTQLPQEGLLFRWRLRLDHDVAIQQLADHAVPGPFPSRQRLPCHQGIDVMNFDNKGLPMADPQCVRCSACIQICPTDVLSFGTLQTGTQLPESLDKLRAR